MNLNVSTILALLGVACLAAVGPAAAQPPTASTQDQDHTGHDHAGHDHAAHANEAAPARAETIPEWDEKTLALFASLPVQDGGRIKPLDTYARFKLLQLNGKRAYKDAKGEEGTPLEWLLDTIFFPHIASQYKVFLVENPAVMEALNLAYEEPRDRYSYEFLSSAREDLFTLAQQYASIQEDQRTSMQRQLLNLAHNLSLYERITLFLQFGRQPFHIPDVPRVQELFPGRDHVYFSEVLPKGKDLMQLLVTMREESNRASSADESSSASADDELIALASFLRNVEQASAMSDSMAVFPPSDDPENHTEWLTPADLFVASLQGERDMDRQAAIAGKFERLEETKNDPGEFRGAVASLHTDVTDFAGERGEYGKIPLEVTYYQAQFFYWSLIFYIFAFIVAALTLLRPGSRAASWIAVVALAFPFLIHSAGIAMRCIIRDRPPVTTLYETIIFIAAVAVLVSLIIEAMNKRKIAVSVGAFLGTLGIFLANKYELVDRQDTMPSLIAVLDTNFWLSTHVTTVTIGYSAGILAAAVAHVYILGKAIGLKKNDKAFYKNLTRMTYGIICFGLVFATVGTVLGGIWANDSWGRFWGWDPKENGALMIVLGCLAILHLRMGGYLRDFGINMAAIGIGMVVAFSWFGVNLLGVGLHSYGFTSGISKALTLFYGIESAVLFIGAVVWLFERGAIPLPRKALKKTKTSPKPSPTAKQQEDFVK